MAKTVNDNSLVSSELLIEKPDSSSLKYMDRCRSEAGLRYDISENDISYSLVTDPKENIAPEFDEIPAVIKYLKWSEVWID